MRSLRTLLSLLHKPAFGIAADNFEGGTAISGEMPPLAVV
jgi:hypothetical protein